MKLSTTLPMFLRRAVLFAVTGVILLGQEKLTWQQKEEFLLKGNIGKRASASKGVTGTERVTLSKDGLTHDASVQRIDEYKARFEPAKGPPELNFHDSYRFNIAGWKLAVLLGMENMVPPSVQRNGAAYTWWVDDVIMDEGERVKKNAQPTDMATWGLDSAMMNVFDELIQNMDRNQGNMLIDKNWRLWLIDHTRAFRWPKTLRNPQLVTRVDRKVLAKMKALGKEDLRKGMSPYIGNYEIDGILGRRDAIVKIIEAKGEGALFDLPARP